MCLQKKRMIFVLFFFPITNLILGTPWTIISEVMNMKPLKIHLYFHLGSSDTITVFSKTSYFIVIT